MAQIDRIYLMQLFVKIIHLGTFSAAADKMGIAASKATKDIQQLEKDLGSVLLNRSTRSIGITNAGELYYDAAMEILASYDGLLDNLNYIKNRLTGELRITAPELWGNIVLTPLVFEFKKKYPDVSIRASYSNDIVDLIRENIHIAFRSTNLTNEPYLSKRISTDRSVLCASTEYIKKNTLPEQLSDLEKLDYITFSHSENTYNRLEFDYQGSLQSITLTGSLTFNSKKSVYDAVVRHQGAAVLPNYIVQQGIEEGTLVTLLPGYSLQSKNFYAFYTQRKKDSALVGKFIDFVQNNVTD
ncbi:LysR family transcriptional regulator [Motiliproteus sp. MSK22-1]|uniref:LysR family transcriptional regulator n=1 Tax=Motiliproteus sp. MSK22-1 TaxID=1897630 RepID=UPI00097703F9|nr:LysR family transcriptional regulator [Motiliproteus sp. MSK22-1]OMH37998.1 hypothetical protein BGP75_06840 [Motiliproteus sp. MSK22-1]